jgi:hypothetical protein
MPWSLIARPENRVHSKDVGNSCQTASSRRGADLDFPRSTQPCHMPWWASGTQPGGPVWFLALPWPGDIHRETPPNSKGSRFESVCRQVRKNRLHLKIASGGLSKSCSRRWRRRPFLFDDERLTADSSNAHQVLVVMGRLGELLCAHVTKSWLEFCNAHKCRSHSAPLNDIVSTTQPTYPVTRDFDKSEHPRPRLT